MKESNKKIKEKALKIAQKCLKKAIKERDKRHKNSLLFQFNLQMKRFCSSLAVSTNKPHQKQTFLKYSRYFDAISKIYKKKVE